MGFAEDFKAALQNKEFRDSFQKLVINGGIDLGAKEGGGGSVTDDELAAGLAGALSKDVIADIFSAGGDPEVFQQDVNTAYSGARVALYDARLYAGPFTHPLTNEEMPKQATVFDDILAAIGPGPTA